MTQTADVFKIAKTLSVALAFIEFLLDDPIEPGIEDAARRFIEARRSDPLGLEMKDPFA